MAKRTQRNNFVNPEHDAERALEAVLNEKTDTPNTESSAPSVEQPVEPVVQTPPRLSMRVLLLVDDPSLFDKEGEFYSYMLYCSQLFEELHIIAVTPKHHPPETVRVAPNVWVYPTCSNGYMRTLYAVYCIAKTQLAFSAGFRADCVYVYNAPHLAFAALCIGRRYKRPYVIYAAYDPFHVGAHGRGWGDVYWFLEHAAFWRTNALHVRSRTVATTIHTTVPKHVLVEVLPAFYDLRTIMPDAARAGVDTPYPFTLLSVQLPVRERNPAFLINICAPIMERYATVGLVIAGDGTDRSVIERRINEEHLASRITFISLQDLPHAMQHAHLLLHTAAHEEYEPILALAGVLGLPMLMTPIQESSLMFTDQVSALVCQPYSASCYLPKIEQFLSNTSLRMLMAQNAREVVRVQYEGSFERHMTALYQSLEDCLVRYTQRV